MTLTPVATLTEAREIAARTFAAFAPGMVKAVHVEMTFGEVVVDEAGTVMLLADYESRR
jgi:hypothetical protein